MGKRCCMNADGSICCSTALAGRSNVADLVLDIIAPFHDRLLEDASRRIKEILDEVKKGNKDPNRELVLLNIADSGFLLAWAERGLDPESSEEELRKTFGIGQTKN